ncbi:T9SS type A sorting domain-containing protein [Neolewinella persica]|uniref:T9SS type A sorting domain-containing protein n=1 Tax=Neolewinella persica TaxID=70998 RepID=UPI00037737DD|nr:T9SS type A sorting domain-containing protein [Neolewinella persica]
MRLLILLFLILPSSVFACSCFWTEDFCEYTANYFEWTEGKVVVARAKFIEFRSPTVDGFAPLFDFEILEVLVGELTENHVTLWGQDGANCNGPVIEMDEGQEYMVMFPSTEGYSSAYGSLSGGIPNRYPIYDYPGCGPATLVVQGERVSGPIAEGVNAMFKPAFYDQLAECVGEENMNAEGPTVRYKTYEAIVRPNPASDHFIVEFETEVPVFAVSLYDVLGRLVSRDQLGGVGTTSHEVNVSGLPAGVYILVVETDGIRVKRRIVVNG